MRKNIIILILSLVMILISCVLIISVINKKTLKDVDVSVEAHELNLDYLRGENGKLATIMYCGIYCDSVELVLYDNNTYELIKGKDNIIKGTYDANVVSMFGMMSSQKLTEENQDAEWKKYMLITGKGEKYITNDNNIPLNTLLKELNIKLDTCKH